jgi:hypothetical protein
MICADFLGGVSLENNDQRALLWSLQRLAAFLSPEHKQEFLQKAIPAT